ncbi:TetR/AcrR family transcriptional regulator [Actinokineospora sp. G85]|uniref:TetR/AcrR family transcriptional regulator n=1 Tax=Actinokineospora sp. G85 TaxID=3406626 RepID=UPI003C743F23
MNEVRAARPRGRSAAKRQAIAEAAREVFLRDGFTRASVDEIATQASVSKRTIYNHFTDKEALFTEIIEESSARTATAFAAAVTAHLAHVTDVEADLVAFGRAWLAPDSAEGADHGDLVRLVIAEAVHHPAIVRAWHAAGPRRARRELAAVAERLSGEGHLAVADPDEAAAHFIALVHSPVRERSLYGALPLPESEVDRIVRDGVRAFLRLHGS